jgi:hypothetical protein
MQSIKLPPTSVRRWLAFALVVWAIAAPGVYAAESRNLAPGFSALPKNAKLLVMPTDIELFQVSMGGILEPKADWTEAAHKHFKAALVARKRSLGVQTLELTDKDADEAAEINTLHAAVARAIQLHHFGPSLLHLPTKEGKLDWSMGEPVRMLKEKTGADYALFTWIRDTYTSPERIAAMIALAVVGIGIHPGGMQIGYASLVDLGTGRVVWFNQLQRGTGDLREPQKAAETLTALLAQFPPAR